MTGILSWRSRKLIIKRMACVLQLQMGKDLVNHSVLCDALDSVSYRHTYQLPKYLVHPRPSLHWVSCPPCLHSYRSIRDDIWHFLCSSLCNSVFFVVISCNSFLKATSQGATPAWVVCWPLGIRGWPGSFLSSELAGKAGKSLESWFKIKFNDPGALKKHRLQEGCETDIWLMEIHI